MQLILFLLSSATFVWRLSSTREAASGSLLGVDAYGYGSAVAPGIRSKANPWLSKPQGKHCRPDSLCLIMTRPVNESMISTNICVKVTAPAKHVFALQLPKLRNRKSWQFRIVKLTAAWLAQQSSGSTSPDQSGFPHSVWSRDPVCEMGPKPGCRNDLIPTGPV